MSSGRGRPSPRLGANRKNGKRLSENDKRHAIVLALQTWPDKPADEIAKQIDCSRSWVSAVRSQDSSSGNLKVTGKDGKSYPASRPQKGSDRSATSSAPAFKSRAAVTERRDRLRALAADGYTREQAAAAVGLGVPAVSSWAKAEGVVFPADAVVGNYRRLDANRVVAAMAETAAHLTDDVQRIALADLHQDYVSARSALRSNLHLTCPTKSPARTARATQLSPDAVAAVDGGRPDAELLRPAGEGADVSRWRRQKIG